jgi:hypothetical protein
MKSLVRIAPSCLAGVAALLLIFVFGCTENLTDPEPPLFARPGSVDVVDVTATVPDSAVQDTTLMVDVLGDGFDDGSTVDFVVDDTVAQKLKVKNVNYVNKKKLVVELEVDAAAEVLRYDVRVSTKRGPRGVGTELFRVVEKVKPNEAFQVSDFTVTQVDPSLAPTRCPELDIPCNRLDMSYTGHVDSLTFFVGNDAEGLYFDTSVENNLGSMTWFRSRAVDPYVPAPGHTVMYWQGQWRHYVIGTSPAEYTDVRYIPDLNVEGEDDLFVFTFVYWDGSELPHVYMEPSHRLAAFANQYAVYRGAPSTEHARVLTEEPYLSVIPGKNKNFPDRYILRFPTTVVDQSGVAYESAGREVLLTHPDGSREIFRGKEFVGDTIVFYRELTTAGCYSMRVVSAEVARPDNPAGLPVWDPSVDTAGATTRSAYFDGTALTSMPGGCN